MMVARVQEEKRKCTCASQASACTRFGNMPLAKPSHMSKPGINVGGDQELQGRQPDTGRPIWRP